MPGSRNVRRLGAVIVAFGMAIAAAVLPGTPAVAAVSDCSQWGVTQLQGGQYTYQQNEWNSQATQCASIDTGTGAWSITQASFNLPTNGAPATYPSSYKGCHWGNCTSGSGLPIQVSQLGSATTSVSTNQVASGAYNASYDIWFNSTPSTTGQPDGTELMIWLNSRGGVQPFGSQTGTANLAGHSWDVWTGAQTSWKIISYRLQGGGTSFTNLDVKALITDAANRGSINSAHYLIDSEFGFEIWQGGQGLGVNSYSFQAGTSGGGGGDTTPPTAPSNLTATGTTDTSVSLSWNAASDNVGVTAYDIYAGSSVVKTVTGSPPTTSTTVTGLSPSTSYTFTVKARDAAGNTSAASNAVTATTTPGTVGGSWTISLQAISPNPTSVNTATNVTVDFKNTASTMASNVTLVIMVADSTGAVVGSQSWAGQNIASQQTLNETYTWTPRSSGSFTVKAKVTNASGGTLSSNDNVGTVTVR